MAARALAHLAKGEKPRADQLTAEALKLAPDNRFATAARARVLIDANMLDEAERLRRERVRKSLEEIRRKVREYEPSVFEPTW